MTRSLSPRLRTRSPIELLGLALLTFLLAALLWGAITFDRTGRPSLVGDEATYAMQAASLGFDLDLSYERGDYDRFVRHWGGPPDGLILQSRDQGAQLAYGKPFLYALAVAPFVRVAPVRGALVGNVLYFAAALVLAGLALRRRIGEAAWLWIVVFGFASVSFGYAFWVHADLFLLSCVAAAFGLAFGSGRGEGLPAPDVWVGETSRSARRALVRWVGVGALAAVAGAYRPFYLILFVPLALAIPRESRRDFRLGLLGLALGGVLLLGLSGGGQWLAGGSFTGYGGERQGFYPKTGFPLVDFPATEWTKSIEKWGNTSWTQEGAIEASWDPRLWKWNVVYFFVGRNVGVLPYFLPLLLGFFAYRGERGRWLIPWAVLVAVVCLIAVRPFNFYGGGGAIADRYFLPLYPALWFVAGRRMSARGGALAAVAVAACAAPFLLPLWSAPQAFPIGEDGRYRFTSEVARTWLPYETTQSHIPGGQDMSRDGLWVKFLDRFAGQRKDRSWLMGDEVAHLLIGSPKPLHSIRLDFDRRAPSHLEVEGGRVGAATFRADGGIGFDVALGEPRAVHPMWWSRDGWLLYEVALRLPDAKPVEIAMRLRPGPEVVEEGLGESSGTQGTIEIKKHPRGE